MHNVKITQKRGSVLIVLIIAMVITGTLGTSMYLLSTTSTFGSLVSNRANRALLLAESGIRYDQKTSLADGTVTVTLNSSADQFIITKSTNAGTGVKTTVSTGIADANSSWPVQRTMTYVSGSPGSSPSPLGSPDRLTNLNNFSTTSDGSYGSAQARNDTGGASSPTQMLIMDSPHNVIQLKTGAGTLNDLLKSLWVNDGNRLSYYAQVKVKVYQSGTINGTNCSNNNNFAASLYFRRHNKTTDPDMNTSYGISFLRLKNRNDANLTPFDPNQGPPSPPVYDFITNQTYIVLWKDTEGGSGGFRTLAYAPLSDVTAPNYATIMVRITETTAPSSGTIFTSGARVNEIQVYYSTNSSGSGNTNPIDTTRIGNLRSGTIQWSYPGYTTTANDFFTLVQWNPANTGNGWDTTTPNAKYEFVSTTDGANTLIRTNDFEHLTNTAVYYQDATHQTLPHNPFPAEIALAAEGANVDNCVAFDDFAIAANPPGSGPPSTGYYSY